MKKTAFSTLALAAALSTAILPATNAFAQYYDGPPPRWDDRRPPPRWDDRGSSRHHHRDNTGRVIAGGLAAGVIGGLIGGAIANGGPRYVEPPPPPPPRCWMEDRRVPNAYDGGWHIETLRVCN
ncbi:hypothetical protein EPK99_18395 [Neorhizobium lilium]|uniref:Transmembrane protein n=1 Tax=Neorhizobium lilium TaxID=2503024 RepID=A0A444LCT8_9HYPH|nr:hypothetical protein [Neorhizobium lilium]RWX75663.1 hypothetical protein EPK99_18395 [Neorhizobium lilium]